MGRGGVDTTNPGVSFLYPICKTRHCVKHYTHDLFKRACSRLRFVFMGSYAESHDVRVLHRATGRCPRLRKQVEVIRRRIGGNIKRTHGALVRTTAKRFLLFISTSSCISASLTRQLTSRRMEANTSIILCSYGIINTRKTSSNGS